MNEAQHPGSVRSRRPGVKLSQASHASLFLRMRQRFDSSTRFSSACTHSTLARTTTRTAHTHERAQSMKFFRMAWRQPRTLQCSLPSFPAASCKATVPAELKFSTPGGHAQKKRLQCFQFFKIGTVWHVRLSPMGGRGGRGASRWECEQKNHTTLS